MSRGLRAIILTGLIVGAMDITSAFIIAWSRGSTAMRLLQFVASGALGGRAFAGGTASAALGLAFHFLIAFSVVTAFCFARSSLSFVREYAVASGIAYGLVVYAVMNLIVLPLSAAKTRHALVPDLIQIAIHMFVIGLATSLLLRRFSGASGR